METMCELAQHVYSLRDSLKDRLDRFGGGDSMAVFQMMYIDKLMAMHSEECERCEAIMIQRRKESK